MGLEAGWNCHISLLSQDKSTAAPSASDSQRSSCRNITPGHDLSSSSHQASRLPTAGAPAQLNRHSNKSRFLSSGRHRSSDCGRRYSAPGAINLQTPVVKFETKATRMTSEKDSSSEDEMQQSSTKSFAYRNSGDDVRGGSKTRLRHEARQPLLPKRNQKANQSEQFLQSSVEETYFRKRLSSYESFPALSYVTDNTDSVTGGLGLSNRVRSIPG